MPLPIGARIGPYEIVAAVGAGGMGEVYRGHDARLDRTVAIKVLPDAVAGDPERLARFEREARVLASLNHPNIAQIYGLEGNALAMEFVEGEDLSAAIARGVLPVDEALDMAGQLADALDAAHALGIVHRDLKPSNIRIRTDGTVKVLDFGLAKALLPAAELTNSTSAPTVTSPALTGLGAIIGTAVYMAPEQAKGRGVDKRGDIWAFGVVLYEMVTGRRPFDGETVSEVLAAVIKSEPDWSRVPPRLQRLLRSCLEKDPKRRLRDIGDWTRQLDEPTAAGTRALSRPWLAWGTAAVLLVALAGLGVAHFADTEAAPDVVRFEITAPAGQTLTGAFAVAPDGRRMAFSARDEKGTSRLWVRDFEALESRPIPGTEGARSPFWKPDGQVIGFVAGQALKKVPATGGPVVTLCVGPSAGVMGGGAWGPNGIIIFGGTTGGVIRSVPESGGDFTRLTELDPARGEVVHGIPSWLPDGRHFLYVAASSLGQSGIFVGSLDEQPEDQDREPIRGEEGSQTLFVEMGQQGGRILFLRDGTLMAQPFDVERRASTGQAVPIAEHVGNIGAAGYFSATRTALVYRTGTRSGASQSARLAWLDRGGNTVHVVDSVRSFGGITVSPDGRRAGVTLMPSMNTDVWLADLDRDVLTPLTTNPTDDRGSVWSPDGKRIVFRSNRNGRPSDLFVKAVDGTGSEDLLLQSDRYKEPTSWSPDGRFLLYTAGRGSDSDVWILPLQADGTPMPILQTDSIEGAARFSPDGRWIAYQSNVSSRSEIYVRPFDPDRPASGGAVTQVSTSGGSDPKWRGRELFFVSGGTLMAVDVTTAPTFTVGVPRELFQLPAGMPWDVAPDGKRVLVAMPTGEEALAPIAVVLNWGAGSR